LRNRRELWYYVRTVGTPNHNQTNAMTCKTNVIDGLRVELELQEDLTQGWVYWGNFSASLEAMYQQGVLTSDFGDSEKRVAPQTREKIYSWAVANGY